MRTRRWFWKLAPYGVALMFVAASMYSGETILALMSASMMASSGALPRPTLAGLRRAMARQGRRARAQALRVFAAEGAGPACLWAALAGLNALLSQQSSLGAVASLICLGQSMRLLLLMVRCRLEVTVDWWAY